MRVPMIAGNWKMNTTVDEAKRLVTEMRPALDRIEGVDRVVCPPFVSLTAVASIIKGSTVGLGAQNVYFEEKGAFTGEVSPLMLAGLCQYFNEDGPLTNKKVKAVLKAGLKPILCVGEQLRDNVAGKTAEVVTGQLEAALVDIKDVDGLVVAYEPVWAIGTGRAATGAQSNETIGLIRSTIARLYGRTVADGVRILYGGSVTADN